MCAWITLDKPSREHIFSHFLWNQQGKASTHPENIGMTRIFWWLICSVQSLGHVWLFETPWTAALQASLSITNSQSLLKLMSIERVMPTNVFILCSPLLFLPSIFPSIRVFSNESVLHIISSKYWTFSFCISPSNAYSGVICFRIDWLDLLAVQGTLTNLVQEEQDGKRSCWTWNTFLFMDTSGIHLQTQKWMQNTSWEWTGVHDQQKRIYRPMQNSMSSPEPLEWVHWLQDPRLPEN